MPKYLWVYSIYYIFTEYCTGKIVLYFLSYRLEMSAITHLAPFLQNISQFSQTAPVFNNTNTFPLGIVPKEAWLYNMYRCFFKVVYLQIQTKSKNCCCRTPESIGSQRLGLTTQIWLMSVCPKRVFRCNFFYLVHADIWVDTLFEEC